MTDTEITHKPDRRRTIRIKHSALVHWKLDDIDRPAIKIAETSDELSQTFSLVHNVYTKMGYLGTPKPSGQLFCVHSLLPRTVIFIAKSYLTVISTLTLISDTTAFGLPMDAIYRNELDKQRSKGRRIAELSALVTCSKQRWRNLFMLLSRVMVHYACWSDVNTICITVNPKHVRFYKEILFFKDFGPERHYPKVNHPAVALYIDLDNIEDDMNTIYSEREMDSDPQEYFSRIMRNEFFSRFHSGESCTHDCRQPFLDWQVIDFFFCQEDSLFRSLSSDQKDYLTQFYPKNDLGSGLEL